MPAFSRLSIPELLPAATRLFTGLRDNPEIAADLKDFGYDRDDADAGLALIAAIRKAIKDQSTEELEKIAASKASATATATVRAAFVVHRRRARRAHPEGTAGYSALDLAGTVPDDELELLADARHFYEALQTSPDLAAPIRNLPPKAVADALALVDAAETADDLQTEESGEAQRASGIVAPLVARLRAECSQLSEDAKDALAPKPQLREVLGLIERGT